jgi:uridine kinase
MARELFSSPYFALGLGLRVALILWLTPAAVDDWYAPFVQHFARSPSADPWTAFLASGGDPRAFPYGLAMLLALLPGQLLLGAWSASKAYLVSILAFDIALLLVLRATYSTAPPRKLLLLYWLSPIVVFAAYWAGLNDVVPVCLLFATIAALEYRRPRLAGCLMALAVSAKLSMVLALPILVIYLLHNKPARRFLPAFAGFGAGAGLLLMLPQLASAGGRSMLFGNPEMQKVYDLAISYGEYGRIYVLPIAYLLALYWIWRFRRLRFDLLIAALAIAFMLVLLLTPAAPGWFVWVIPCLVWFQLRSDRISVFLVGIFSALYVWQLVLPPFSPSAHLVALSQTLLVALGIAITIRILNHGVQSNEYYRLSRRPLVIGIAGDSGAGKDTLAAALAGLFGAHSTARLSGDDYHLWDRQKPTWQAMTHLNPRANDLSKFASDVARLAAGREISPRPYDHALGQSGRPQQLASNDFVVVSGLHAIFLPALRASLDLSVYLDMDEGLRRWLKLRRDVKERGHSPEQVLQSIERRSADAENFVRPQSAFANLVLSVRPAAPLAADASLEGALPRLALHVRSRHSIRYDELVRLLVSFAGLGVESRIENDGGMTLDIEGDVGADAVAHVAQLMLPRLRDLLDLEPQWQPGVTGLMQLIVLVEASEVLAGRMQ